jgi:hypothetical protein
MITSEYPRHDKTHFYKYTSAQTAKTILRKKTYRYSSPILFNDPFDVQTELLFDFGIEKLSDLVIQKVESIILSKKNISINKNHGWGQVLTLLKDKVRKHGYRKAEIRKILGLTTQMLGKVLEDTRYKYNKVWQNYFLPRLRIFSVSAIKDSVLMWSHYGEDHTGVVFELNVLPDIDNTLCVADPIIYVPKPPVFHTSEEWVNEIIGIETVDQEKIYWEYARTKSDIWSYEQEWRVWDLLPEAGPELFSDYPLNYRELSRIYFGCRINNMDKKEIIALARKINPQVLFYQAQKAKDRYGLEFTET